ncbi:MAG: glycosyltransferase involved in cell wall biosynthesis [Paraglaciecola sp.]|jgi:glycosyltransferase involved in cell wall biosynthesis
MQVSFIIPHKGRFEMLIQTIESISAQDWDLEQLEVLVVSQTPQIAKQILCSGAKLTVKVFIRPENETISALRNYGFSQSNSPFLAFLDADIWLSENWVGQMHQHLCANPGRIIVSATQICHHNAPILEKIRTSLSNAEIDTNVAFLPGRNLFMRNNAFSRIGGFPEHLITCEDYYFTDQAAQLGELYYTSSATYVHLGEDKAYKPMFDKEIWRGQSNLQSIAGRKIPFREWPSFLVPPGITLTFLLALILLLTGLYQGGLLLLALSFIPIFLYSFRLYKLANNQIAFISIFKFYAVYFPARAIGTFAGLFNSIAVKNT